MIFYIVASCCNFVRRIFFFLSCYYNFQKKKKLLLYVFYIEPRRHCLFNLEVFFWVPIELQFGLFNFFSKPIGINVSWTIFKCVIVMRLHEENQKNIEIYRLMLKKFSWDNPKLHFLKTLDRNFRLDQLRRRSVNLISHWNKKLQYTFHPHNRPTGGGGALDLTKVRSSLLLWHLKINQISNSGISSASSTYISQFLHPRWNLGYP